MTFWDSIPKMLQFPKVFNIEIIISKGTLSHDRTPYALKTNTMKNISFLHQILILNKAIYSIAKVTNFPEIHKYSSEK